MLHAHIKLLVPLITSTTELTGSADPSCACGQDKIAAIAKGIYGAADVSYDELAERQLQACEAMGGAQLPICMAKTQYSFSADAAAKGAPSGFTLPIRDVRVRLTACLHFKSLCCTSRAGLAPVCGNVLSGRLQMT